jgi:hypothetical protein
MLIENNATAEHQNPQPKLLGEQLQTDYRMHQQMYKLSIPSLASLVNLATFSLCKSAELSELMFIRGFKDKLRSTQSPGCAQQHVRTGTSSSPNSAIVGRRKSAHEPTNTSTEAIITIQSRKQVSCAYGDM